MIPCIGTAIINRPDLWVRLGMSIDFPVGEFRTINNGCIDLQAIQNPSIQRIEIVNPGANLSCAGGWNALMSHAFDHSDYDCILIVGNDIAFAPGDLQFYWQAFLDFPQADFLFGIHSFSNFMVKRSGWEKVGAADENFELAYCEDGDYWRRIHLSGAKAMHVAGLRTIHEGSATIKSDPAWQRLVKAQQELNWNYYSAKHGCPKFSSGQETFTTPFNQGGPINEWRLSPERLTRPHFFPKWPI